MRECNAWGEDAATLNDLTKLPMKACMSIVSRMKSPTTGNTSIRKMSAWRGVPLVKSSEAVT